LSSENKLLGKHIFVGSEQIETTFPFSSVFQFSEMIAFCTVKNQSSLVITVIHIQSHIYILTF